MSSDAQTPVGGSSPEVRLAVGGAVPGRPELVLEKLLGQGGFGEVWLARQVDSGDLRVFKFCFEADQIAALERETTLFRLLKEELGARDDIARILDWSFDSEPCFIELEYSSGGDLHAWSDARGGLEQVPLDLRLELICQIADALAAAHSVGVLHKDVKPGNILVHETDDGEAKARLTDFGIGQVTNRALLKDRDVTELEWPASSSGLETAATELYEAPELVEGRAPTVQADVYALGVVLYQMVICDLSRPLASGWERDVDDELMREVIADACDARPERRFSGASEPAARLRNLEQVRRERETRRRNELEQQAHRAQVESWQRRRRVFGSAAVVLVVFSLIMWGLGQRIESEVARAQRELETATTVSDFLVDLFAAPDGERTEDVVSVEELLQRGAQRAREELGEQPEIQARLLATIGGVQFRLGAFDEGRSSVEKSLEIRRAVFGDDHLQTSQSLLIAGGMNIIVGEIEGARLYLTQGLKIQERALGPLAPEIAGTLRQLGAIAMRENRVADADVLYRRALAILERSPGQEELLGLALVDVAKVYRMSGLPYESVDYLRRAKALHERHLPPDHPTLGQLYATLGDAYSVLEVWDEAEPVLLKAQAIFEPRLGSDHPYLAAILSSLGRVYLKRGELDAAEDALRRVIAIVEPSMGSNNLYLQAPLTSLAQTLAAKGDIVGAVETYDRVLVILSNHLAEGDPRIAATRDMRAAALAARDAAP